jgi:phenylpropionate dioxygenase-like ring-hydroxylating dioxygenase large terminal subunit
VADRPRPGLLPQLGLRRPRRAGAAAGSWLRVEIAEESILLVRGKDDALRGFYNVCRHRGSPLCDDEQGEVRSHLRCPYHAWGYALDGTLVTTPMIERDEIDRRARRCGRCTSTCGRASSS